MDHKRSSRLLSHIRHIAQRDCSADLNANDKHVLFVAAAEIERMRWELRSYEQLGGDAERYAALWREENPFTPEEGW